MSRFFKLRPSPISRKVLFTSAVTKAVTSKPLLAFVQVSFAKHFAFLALLLRGFQLKVDDLGFPDVKQKLRDILCTRPQNNFHHPVAGLKQVMALRYSLTTVFAQRHTSLSVRLNRLLALSRPFPRACSRSDQPSPPVKFEGEVHAMTLKHLRILRKALTD